jgi:uncharacterized protein
MVLTPQLEWVSEVAYWLFCMYNAVVTLEGRFMRYEWDENKNERNLEKHGLSFETASLVFDDPNALSIPDRIENGEERWQTIGMIENIVIVMVAHTIKLEVESQEEIIRIISARKATRAERQEYEEAIW